jgi:hypothetical protein
MTPEQSKPPRLNEHEAAFVRSFIVKPRQERSMYLLNSMRRRDFTIKLEHERWIDMRFATHIPGSVAHTADELVNLLKKMVRARMFGLFPKIAKSITGDCPSKMP